MLLYPLLSYAVPFLLLVLMPGRRSFALMAVLLLLPVGALSFEIWWMEHHPELDSGPGDLVSALFCWIVFAGYVAGLLTRAVTLSLQVPGVRWRELMPLTMLGFVFPILAVLIGE